DLRHARAVALAGLEPGNTEVAAWTLLHPRADVVEHLLHDLRIVEKAQRLAPRVEIAAPPEGDDPLRHRPDLLRLRLGRGDALVPQQIRDQVAVHRAAVC